MQIDNINELPKEKRPTDYIIWDGSSTEMDEWMEKVMGTKSNDDTEIIINDIDIEG
jgi:hypothetical protein